MAVLNDDESRRCRQAAEAKRPVTPTGVRGEHAVLDIQRLDLSRPETASGCDL